MPPGAPQYRGALIGESLILIFAEGPFVEAGGIDFKDGPTLITQNSDDRSYYSSYCYLNPQSM